MKSKTAEYKDFGNPPIWSGHYSPPRVDFTKVVGRLDGQEVITNEVEVTDEILDLIQKNRKIYFTRLSGSNSQPLGISFECRQDELTFSEMKRITDFETRKRGLIFKLQDKINFLSYLILALTLIIIALCLIKN